MVEAMKFSEIAVEPPISDRELLRRATAEHRIEAPGPESAGYSDALARAVADVKRLTREDVAAYHRAVDDGAIFEYERGVARRSRPRAVYARCQARLFLPDPAEREPA